MNTRSSSLAVRNPVLFLPGVSQAIAGLTPENRAALRAILMALRADASAKAAKSWATHKAPMACYWKCIAVYAGHIARALKNPSPAQVGTE